MTLFLLSLLPSFEFFERLPERRETGYRELGRR
jgi:hypothetical protein